jgi:hypothetical protein
MIRRAKKVAMACAFVAISGLSASSYGALVKDTIAGGGPVPNTAGFPEIKYDGGTPKQLQADIGATGNASVSAAGGLDINTPFNIDLGLAYAASVSHPGEGTTTFSDVTLVISNLYASGAANVIALIPGGGSDYVIQALTPGHFKLLSHDPDGFGPTQKVTLLEGDITSAFITGFKNAGSGNVSGNVTYTGGVIKDALVLANGGLVNGEMSWSLLNLNPVLSTTGGASPILNNFVGDLLPQFDAQIPEPATLGVLALGTMGFLARRRNR